MISSRMFKSAILGQIALTIVQIALGLASHNFLLSCNFFPNCTLIHVIIEVTNIAMAQSCFLLGKLIFQKLTFQIINVRISCALLCIIS